ncbi:phosphoribosylanthranilate isomerase [Candidatus Sumerlaeota bacterium]|nr:phosphoribosylanthranilate isomerase [Candidatus Sumerlaeota bacterium]
MPSTAAQRTRVKICGIANLGDGFEAARLGVEFLGFIFYPPSPRYIEPAVARDIVQAVRARHGSSAPAAIGVFVDEEPDRIQAVRTEVGLDGIQFSGDESPEVVERFEPIRFRGLSIETLDRLGRYRAEAYLCDTHAPQEKGGTGRPYDYEILKPYTPRHRIVVAGGLTPQSVGGVVLSLRPWGVDVSSAIEVAPGRKDHVLMRAFVQAVRNADLS